MPCTVRDLPEVLRKSRNSRNSWNTNTRNFLDCMGVVIDMSAFASALGFFAVLAKLQYLFVDGIPQFRKSRKQLNAFQRVVFHSIGSFALEWNNMKLHNVAAIDSTLDSGRSCLLLGYHSRCTTDLLLLLCLLQPKLIVTHLFFKVPIFSDLFYFIGFLPSKSSSFKQSEDDSFAEHLSQCNYPLMLLPGGIFEALKPFSKRYQVDWKGVPGYARVLESRVNGKEWKTAGLSVVPFYTRNSEDFYPTTPFLHDYVANCFYYFYSALKRGNLLVTPLVLSLGLWSLGLVVCPRPVQLDTVFGEPLHWQPKESAEEFNARVVKSLQALVTSTNLSEEYTPKPVKWTIRRILFGIFMVLQNSFFAAVVMTLIWLPFPLLVIITVAQYAGFFRSSTKSQKKKK